MRRTLILLLSAFILISCNKESELAEQMLANKESYEQISVRFLNQRNIKWITIYHEYDEYGCHTINNWSRCPPPSNSERQFKSALRNNNIELREYELYHEFLLSNGLSSISGAFRCRTCVEFEYKTFGLRFSSIPHELTEDNEYISVNKIDDNWYSYTRDWN